MYLFILMVKRLKMHKELFAGLRALDEQGATTILRKDLQKLV